MNSKSTNNESPAALLPMANDPPLVKLTAMLQALEFEPAAVNLSAEVLAAACRAIARQAKDTVALRAENETLRTVVESKFPLTDEDVKQIMDEFVKHINTTRVRRTLRRGAKIALQSFIRSK